MQDQSELQFPILADMVLAPTVVRLLAGQLEAGRLVEMPRGVEALLRPQHHLVIDGGAHQAQALGDQSLAGTAATCRARPQEHAQLGDPIALPYQRDAADRLAIELGDPAALARWIVLAQEWRHDLDHQRLEARVPTVFVGIDPGVRADDPADIARPVLPHRDRLRWRLVAEEPFDRRHGG